MEMQGRRSDFEALRATVVAAGFSPAPALATLADRLEWPWGFLADPERVLYERLGLQRASLRDVLGPGAVRHYRDAVAQGREVHRPVEDPRQLGADAVVVESRTVWLRRQVSPDDRPSAETVLQVVARVAGPDPNQP